MLHVTVLIAALLGQTVYTWTDAQGEEHYTDDPSTIPKGVKAKTMAQGEVEPVRAAPEPAPSPAPATRPKRADDSPDAGAGKPKENSCVRAKKALADAEAEVEEARKASAEPPSRDCQEVLNTLGHAAYAQCMAARKTATDPARALATAQRRLDEAKDALRRAQVAGCP